MLDNRHLLPLGTIVETHDGTPRILIYGKNGKDSARVLPVTAKLLGWKRFIGVPDIADPDESLDLQVETSTYCESVLSNMAENHKKNLATAKELPVPQTDTVIIAASGAIPERDMEIIAGGSIPVIALGRAVKAFETPEYCVVSDYNEVAFRFFDGVDLSSTCGVLSTTVMPDMARLPWKEVTWYTSLPRRADGLRHCYSTEGVITDALWFAIKCLGAKKVIFVGVEQPATNSVYFWEGIFLQTHCFFYARLGTKIWNCTPATSVLAGVILGSLEEACR